MVSVKLLDKSLKLDSSKGLLTTHVSELKVAEIPMGAKVIVISGKEKGLTGVVNVSIQLFLYSLYYGLIWLIDISRERYSDRHRKWF